MHLNNIVIAPLLAGAAFALLRQMPLADEGISQDVTYSMARFLDTLIQFLGKHEGASESVYTATDKKLESEVDCETLPTFQEQTRCLKEGGVMVYGNGHEQVKAQFCDSESDPKACFVHGGWVSATSAKNNKAGPEDVLDAEAYCENLPTIQEQMRYLGEGGLQLHADHDKAV